MTSWFYIILFATSVCGEYKISAPDNVINELTKAGHDSLKEEMKNGMKESESLQKDFKAANETCQKSLVSLIDNCSSCVKDHCWMRVKTLNCSTTSDFNKTIEGGINRIGGKIDHFFRDTLPRFFTEDLTQFFGQDVPFFFEHDFKDFFTDKVPSFFKNEFSKFFVTDIPNFFNSDLPHFFQNDFTNFFKNDVKNFFTHDVKGFFDKVGSKITNIFGRRKRESTQIETASEATSCENFVGEDNVQKYCFYYVQNCSECLPSQAERAKVCPDLAKVHNKMKQFGWIIAAATKNGSIFDIISISNGDEEPKDGVYNKPVVELVILGKNATIKMDEPIKLSDKTESAKKIAKKAINYYQLNTNETLSK